jgi:regulator of replication initiation timing
VRLVALPAASEAASSIAAFTARAPRTWERVALELKRTRAVSSEGRDGLSRTLRALATDLAIIRRDCREQRDEIEALRTEVARLSAATSNSAEPDAHINTDDGPRGRDERLGARRAPPEHTIGWMVDAVLALRRGNIVLKEENAGLRLELERLRAGEQRRSTLAPAQAS